MPRVTNQPSIADLLRDDHVAANTLAGRAKKLLHEREGALAEANRQAERADALAGKLEEAEAERDAANALRRDTIMASQEVLRERDEARAKLVRVRECNQALLTWADRLNGDLLAPLAEAAPEEPDAEAVLDAATEKAKPELADPDEMTPEQLASEANERWGKMQRVGAVCVGGVWYIHCANSQLTAHGYGKRVSAWRAVVRALRLRDGVGE